MLYGPYKFDENLFLAGSLDARDLVRLKQARVDLVINNRPDGESEKQMPSWEMKRVLNAMGIPFIDIPFQGAKMTAADVDAFRHAIAGARKVLAVCATGTRCAMIAAAAEVRGGLPLELALGKARNAGFELMHMDSFIGSFAPRVRAAA